MSGEITAKEMGPRGGKSTAAKYPAEERRNWATKGGQTTKTRHGKEYYQELNRKSHEAKMLKKLQQAQK